MKIWLGDQYVENKLCSGCMCHELPIQFGETLSEGCCRECCCPKTKEAWKEYERKNKLYR